MIRKKSIFLVATFCFLFLGTSVSKATRIPLEAGGLISGHNDSSLMGKIIDDKTIKREFDIDTLIGTLVDKLNKYPIMLFYRYSWDTSFADKFKGVNFNFLDDGIADVNTDFEKVPDSELFASSSMTCRPGLFQQISLEIDCSTFSIYNFDSNGTIGENFGLYRPSSLLQDSATVTQQQVRVSEPSTFLLMSSALTVLGFLGNMRGGRNKWENTIPWLIKRIVSTG